LVLKSAGVRGVSLICSILTTLGLSLKYPNIPMHDTLTTKAINAEKKKFFFIIENI
jgi:hypothetical protein